MFWHADNSTYGWLLQGFASSSNIAGPYTFIDATSPLGNWSQDFGMFTDFKDGKSYSLWSNGDRKEGRDVYLTSYNDDITALDKVVHRFDKYDLEAPTIVQTEKSYFALMSHKTGYRPNSKSFPHMFILLDNEADRKQMLLPSVPILFLGPGASRSLLAR
jgi:hypothetical protein